jgi:hypothetical protein
LFRGESDSLDYKKEQYRFVKALDDKKAELLKDILAMANSWRAEPAYILIGVEDEKPIARVVGITDHLDDAQLQQFVNAKTNKPVSFLYSTAQLNGVAIGIIKIELQDRPIFLKSPFAWLKANTVYVRRGSSTVEALPDEVAKMGAAAVKSLGALRSGELKIAFEDAQTRQPTNSQSISAINFELCGRDTSLPDYAPPPEPFRIHALYDIPNKEFYREAFEYVRARSLLRKIQMTVSNHGQVTSHATRVEFLVHDPARVWEFRPESAYPQNEPKPQGLPLCALPLSDPDFECEYVAGGWRLNFDFGSIQPGRTLSPGISFYAGARESGSLVLSGKVMSDQLSNSDKCELELKATVEPQTMERDAFLQIQD